MEQNNNNQIIEISEEDNNAIINIDNNETIEDEEEEQENYNNKDNINTKNNNNNNQKEDNNKNKDKIINNIINSNSIDKELNNNDININPQKKNNNSSKKNNEECFDSNYKIEDEEEEESFFDEIENNNSESSQKKPFDIINDNNENYTIRRKRRSKKEFSGPSYKCPECGKSYLSMPALNTHRKTKHDPQKFVGRGRGRPRKEPLIISPEELTYEQINNNLTNNNFLTYNIIERRYRHFFEKDNRKLNNNEKIDIEFINYSLNEIFSKFKSNFFDKKYTYYLDYPYLYYIINNWNNIKSNNDINNNKIILITPSKKIDNLFDLNNKLNNNNSIKNDCIDKVFLEYLKECSFKTNKNYYKIIESFIILFREGINIEKNEEYTSKNPCENLPEFLNDIIENYFEKNYFFGLDQNELIDIISHLSHWLYLNKYTDLKITY